MAIALAQENGNTHNSGGGATLVITMGASMTSGNMLVVCAEENDDATGPSIAATGVVFTKQNRFIGDGTHDDITLWTGVIGAGAGTTITITAHGTDLGNAAAIAGEFSGVQQVVDGTPPTPTNVASTTPNVTSNTPTASGDLVVAFCGHTGTTAPTATPSGWTTFTRRVGNNAIEGAWEVNAGSGTQNASWTFAASQNALLEIVLVLQAVTGGASLGDPILFSEISGPGGQYGPNAFVLEPVITGVVPQTILQDLIADAVLVTASMLKQVNKLVTADSVGVTASMVRLVSKALTATSVLVTASLVKQVNKLLSATAVVVTASLVAMKVILKTLTATAVVVTGSIVKQVNKLLTGTSVVVTATMVKQVNKALTATSVVVTATMVAIKVILRTLTATSVVVTASMVRQVGKPLTATAVVLSANIVRQVNKRLTATSVVVTASMAAIKVILKTLTATTVVVSASMVRQVGKPLSATVTLSATIAKRVNKTLISSVSVLGSMVATFSGVVVGPFAAALAIADLVQQGISITDQGQIAVTIQDATGATVTVTDTGIVQATVADQSGASISISDVAP